jgi:hypothetical protein
MEETYYAVAPSDKRIENHMAQALQTHPLAKELTTLSSLWMMTIATNKSYPQTNM